MRLLSPEPKPTAASSQSPPSRAIIAGCSLERLDAAAILKDCKQSGNVAIPLIEQLTSVVARIDKESAAFVHWGATSQDVIDTALVLQLRSYLALLETQLETLCDTFARLATEHRATLMPGRTLLQQAVPITFGLKVATWLDTALRHLDRLKQLKPRILMLQFGGAAGTFASLGGKGWQVAKALSAELSLRLPALPWHTQRDPASPPTPASAALSSPRILRRFVLNTSPVLR